MNFNYSLWLPLIIPAAASILLGLFVWMQRRGRVGVIFFFLTSLLSVWAVTNSVADASKTAEAASFWTTVLMVASAGIPLFLLYFSLEFPAQRSLRVVPIVILAAPFLAVAYLLLRTTYIVQGAVPVNGYAQIEFGPYSWLYFVVFSAYLLTALVLLGLSLRRSNGRLRSQVSVFFVGILVTSIFATVTNLVLPLFFSIYTLSDYSVLTTTVFTCFTAYSIIARHLFDIRLIVRRTVIYSGLLLVLLAIYSLAILLATTLLGNHDPFDYRVLAANIFSSFMISLGYNPLNRWLQDHTDRFLFRKDYERHTLLTDLGHKLNDVLGLDEALEIVMQGMVKTFRLEHAATYVFQMGENSQVVVKRIRQIGYDSHAKLAVEDKDFFTTYFAARESILIIDKMRADLKEDELKIRKARKETGVDVGQMERIYTIKMAVLKKLEALNTAVAIPLRIDKQPIGVILLSPKLSQESFDQEDLNLIDLVGAQVTTAIQKARLYEGDQMKSEFVSIASHELLTPISAMEGYLSMILDEHVGEIDGQTRGYLDKVYTSAKRLSSLVKDMLSASRIESGEMKVEPQQLSLDKVIQDSFDQLRFTAKKKDLKLVYEVPAAALPPAWADKDRTTQVLINLMGNAIKYTPSGSVTVRASAHPSQDSLQVDISDTGMGMAKEQQAHLFEKFYRVYSKNTADVPGTGLGLYITKSLVEKMSGKIWVESEEGKGSTFSFTVPIFHAETSRA